MSYYGGSFLDTDAAMYSSCRTMCWTPTGVSLVLNPSRVSNPFDDT